MEENLNIIKNKIEEADYIAIGCGLDFEKNLKLDEAAIYKPLADLNINSKAELKECVKEEKAVEWIHIILLNYYKKNTTLDAYNDLYELVKDKDYFILTMNTSELIYQSKLDPTKIVSPCGNEGLFQCSRGCSTQVESNKEYIDKFIEQLPMILGELRFGGSIDQYLPRCKECKECLTFNVRSTVEKYVEEGYLPQWQAYLQWLSRTLNRKLVLLELDVNFTLPSLIRWPFEKNAFLNNKAYMVRVNNEFPQLTEEIKGKASSFTMEAKEFLQLVNK